MDAGEALGGRYRLVRRLGSGGMAVIWLAEDDVLNREVAVKVLAPRLAADPLRAEAFCASIAAEARAVARLHHPNIIEVYDYGEVGCDGSRRPFVVMELVEGRSLAELLAGGALPWRVAVLVCAQVAAALAAAHEQGVVHRDVTPPNVMVTASGVKLLDFGICAETGDADTGDDNEIVGTPAYLAPERLEEGLVNPATDVYALGLLLYRALAGRAPWAATSPLEAVRAHRELDPEPLPGIAGLPDEITALCLRCLARQPGERPTAAQIALVLAQAAGIPITPEVAGAPVVGPLLPDVFRAGRAFAPAVAHAGADVTEETRQLDAPSSAWPRRIAVALVVALAIGGMAALQGADPGAPVDSAAGAGSAGGAAALACSVGYAARPATPGRFSAALTVRNTGSTDLGKWRLAYRMDPGRQVTNVWPGTWAVDGSTLTLSGAALPAGDAVDVLLEGRVDEAATPPAADFLLNGTACTTTVTAAAAAVVAAEKDTSADGKSGGRKGGKGKGPKG